MANHNQPDDAIDKALAALKSAAPPTGMEARIAARIAQNAGQPTAPTWRERLRGSSLTSAWWSGAATGAAIAMLAVAAVLLLQHTTRTTPHAQIAANQPATPIAVPVSAAATAPCAQPAVLRGNKSSAAPILTASSPASQHTSSSHPLASSPLTPQERALVRLAQTADPKTLAALDPVNEAQLEEENEAQFKKFFTHPPPPPQPKIDQPTQTDQPADAASSPETVPQSAPANPNTEPAPESTK